MYTVEVPRTRSRDRRRLVRATALLLTGAALHVWLFPLPAGTGRVGFIESMTARMLRATAEQAVGTAGVEAGVIASDLGTMAASPQVSRETPTAPARANRVRIVVETVRPSVAAPLIPTRPARLQNAVFAMVPAPEAETIDAEESAPEQPLALPALADAPVSHALGTTLREPEPPSRAISDSPRPEAIPEKASHLEISRQPDTPSDERLVGYVLQRYRQAYESLDVSAAQTVWPTVDARALGAAFRQLAGQRVTFDSCGVQVSGSGFQATARCTGQAEFVPKVGGRRAYTAAGEWVFDLQKENAAWRIINANTVIK
jgi:hypothetical protein